MRQASGEGNNQGGTCSEANACAPRARDSGNPARRSACEAGKGVDREGELLAGEREERPLSEENRACARTALASWRHGTTTAVRGGEQEQRRK
jgi:hypothetical protein